MIRIMVIAFFGLIIIAVLIGIYIWLGKAERREHLAEKLQNVAETGDEALLLLLAGAQSDEEKEELLRFAESDKYRAVNANKQTESAADKAAPFQSPLTTEEFLAEQQPLGQVQSNEDSQCQAQAESPCKFDLETLPIFNEPEPEPPRGVLAAVDELMRQSDKGENAAPISAEPLKTQPVFNDLEANALLNAPYEENSEDETIIV